MVDYVYDATNRLLSETITEPGKDDRVISYTYDKVGKRLTKTENGFTTTYQYDKNNRLRKEDDIIYDYDDNGNLIEKESAEEQIVYEYDYDNHLIRVETTRYETTIVVTYDYDAEGNRVRKVIDDTVFINYLVDTNRDYAQVVEERNENGDLLVRYVYGHDLISQTRPSAGSGSVTSYYHYDGLGSTRALSSSAGIVTDSYSYDAFGLLLEQTGTTENHYRYRGEQFDEELGFYYLRARYMDPNVGRFVTMDAFAGLSQDPVTLHKYLYANANPMTYSDPSGYFSIGEMNVSTTIRGILDRHSQLMQITKYRYMIGAVTGAVENMVDARLGGASWGKTLIDGVLGGATGAASIAVGGAVGSIVGKTATFLSRFPRLFCKVKALAPIIAKVSTLRGAWGGLKEVHESIKRGEYDQATWRCALLLLSLKDVTHAWKTSACFTGETLVAQPEGYKPIEDIEIGEAVFSENVDISKQNETQKQMETGLSSTWKSLHLEMLSEDGSSINVDLLRPSWWLEQNDARLGESMNLSIPEMGLKGSAKVLSINNYKANFQKTPSGAQIVTGKIVRHNAIVLDLYFSDAITTPLGVTPTHPFWSLDRNGWVEAAKLKIDEQVKTRDNSIVTLTGRRKRPERQTVYNLEVQHDHTYYVSNLEILVHNSCVTTPAGHALTEHAEESLIEHGLTLNEVDDIIENASRARTQSDGATVFIQSVGKKRKRKYNIVVLGDEGIVTGMKNLSPHELRNLGRNYGYDPDAY